MLSILPNPLTLGGFYEEEVQVNQGEYYFHKIDLTFSLQSAIHIQFNATPMIKGYILSGYQFTQYIEHINSDTQFFYTKMINSISDANEFFQIPPIRFENIFYIVLQSSGNRLDPFNITRINVTIVKYFPLWNTIILIVAIGVTFLFKSIWNGSIRSRWEKELSFVQDDDRKTFIVNQLIRLPKLKDRWKDLYCINLGRILEALCVDYSERMNINVTRFELDPLINAVIDDFRGNKKEKARIFDSLKGLLDYIREARNTVHAKPKIEYTEEAYDTFLNIIPDKININVDLFKP
ncbi:MAG: hypothetical protein RBG13Loki_3812 [Promethearchaeota archaeon CR_4]|nr:MAG: hypothetical protein RBG13Loki_3812 [Candidatus Lokiarchaeota archaeon CR_4]